MRRIESKIVECLESLVNPQALHVRESQRAAEAVTVELCQFKGKTMKPKSNISKDIPLFDGTKAKCLAWKQSFLFLTNLHYLFRIFT